MLHPLTFLLVSIIQTRKCITIQYMHAHRSFDRAHIKSGCDDNKMFKLTEELLGRETQEK